MQRKKKSQGTGLYEIVALSQDSLIEKKRKAIYYSGVQFSDGVKRWPCWIVTMRCEGSDLKLVWKIDNSKGEEFFEQTISGDLKKMSKLTSLYFAPSASKDKQSVVTCLYNRVLKKYCFLDELPANDGDVIKAKVSVVNVSLEPENTFTLDIPFGKLDLKRHGTNTGSSFDRPWRCLNGRLKFDDNENIWFNSSFNLSNKEMAHRYYHNSGRDSIAYFSGIVDTKNKKINYTSLKGKGSKYHFGNVRIKSEMGYNLIGFYNVKRAGYHHTYDGVYCIRTNDKFEVIDTIYNKFTANQMFDLYKKDDNPKKKGKKLKEYYERTCLNNLDYLLEKVYQTKDGSVYLIASSKYTSYQRVLNDNNSVSNKYYTYKYDIITIKLSKDGEIIWMNDIDRFFEYGGRSSMQIRDILVKEEEDQLIYIFVSERRPIEGEMKKYRKRILRKKRPIQIVTLNKETGEVKQTEFFHNRWFNGGKAKLIGDSFYTYYYSQKAIMGVRLNTGVVIEKITPNIE